MDKAKAAISDFMGRSGHHDTSVHETVAPAVQHETVKPHQHENINTAVDKEVHQDHYHRTVQPVHDREVLPETHEAKLGGVQHREFDHRDHDTTKRNLVQDQQQFQDKRTVEGTTSSRSVAPTVGGEHVHHHIHETIQPVVHKETIQPNVVHTTVPIHEVHHNKATHHDTTSLPAMGMEQFKSQGGSLHGREERYDEFQGVPKNIGGGTAGGLGAVRGLEHKSEQSGLTHNTTTQGVTGHHDHQHQHQHHNTDRGLAGSSTTGTTGGLTGHHDNQQHTTDRGLAGASTAGGLTGHHDNQHHTDRGVTGTSTTGGLTGHHDNTHHHDRGVTGTSTTGGLSEHEQHRHADRGAEGQGNLTGHNTHGNTTGEKKPSLMDKLNPKVDSNGDGKAGFMK